jgi:hypothetical protein
VFSVRESFIGNLKGAEVEYHKGEIVDANDPALKKWPQLFEPVALRGGSVEQATAAPGEKRRLLSRKPKAAPAKAKAAEPTAAPTPAPTPEATPESEAEAEAEAEGGS